MNDALGRPLRNLRLSVTDRCNLRCEYCMPDDDYVWLPREDVLHFEETSALVDVFLSLGVDKVRLTGGEPLLRRDVPALVQMLATKPDCATLRSPRTASCWPIRSMRCAPPASVASPSASTRCAAIDFSS